MNGITFRPLRPLTRVQCSKPAPEAPYAIECYWLNGYVLRVRRVER